MAAQEPTYIVRGVNVKALTLKRVKMCREVIGNVGETGGVKRGRGERLTGKILATGIDCGVVNVARSLGHTTTLIVTEEVTVARADDSPRRGSPVTAEDVQGAWVDRAIVGAESVRIGGCAGIQLAVSAVRATEMSLRSGIGVVPVGKQT